MHTVQLSPSSTSIGSCICPFCGYVPAPLKVSRDLAGCLSIISVLGKGRFRIRKNALDSS